MYRVNYIEDSAMFRMKFADMVFTSWEFASLHGTKDINQNRLKTQFQVGFVGILEACLH